ncbi:dihydrodipicolinate synthase family protein [Mangrovibrevibacter kandeliae]|uniref:dihydrodipicolinate synthase family protein n=1 Tax=Mangrovibrevibacter kandeliae TaxID=2968473 RepID=UPI0021190494|nr:MULTISPECIES: dihydrodipicolinate synthase family protein [unclassified Aurantimonas]MCQ8781607.1 dihydrodipicolinate synthase family protein [Aurantimonas sp. CSK15Z-1]MCW4114947.1 dihydrodipicolinate synthase family protein [Aurantimonas sp. MSK8Z-1]
MALLTASASGVFVIAVTPFTATGAIDVDSLDRMTDFYLDAGVSGITILGMMGEAPKLTQAEARQVAERVIGRAVAVPVVVGVSAPGLAAIAELSAAVMDLGAAGVMVAPTPSLRTDAEIRGYFGDVAESIGSGVPIVLQDYPLSTSVQIHPKVILDIARDLLQVVMLKHEDWPGLAKITALRSAEAAGARRLSILCGNGGLFLPEEVARGADGAMTGFAFPEMLVEVVRLAQAGNLDRAQDLFDAYLPLVRYEQQPGVGLSVRKHVLAKRGAIASPALRRPGAELAPEALAEVERLLARLERRLAELN